MLRQKIENGQLLNKIKTFERINKQKKEMSRQIFNKTIVDIVKTVKTCQQNRDNFFKIRELEAKYKGMVEEYQNIKLKIGECLTFFL